MNDPIVEEIRRVRDAHAARFNYDLDAIFQDIKEQEKQSGRTFVSFVPEVPSAVPTTTVSELDPSQQNDLRSELARRDAELEANPGIALTWEQIRASVGVEP